MTILRNLCIGVTSVTGMTEHKGWERGEKPRCARDHGDEAWSEACTLKLREDMGTGGPQLVKAVPCLTQNSPVFLLVSLRHLLAPLLVLPSPALLLPTGTAQGENPALQPLRAGAAAPPSASPTPARTEEAELRFR